MVASVSPDQIIGDTSPIKSAIVVGVVDGGTSTNPLWTSQVSNENFKKALEESLALSALAGRSGAQYTLNAKLVSLDQPFMGLDLTVTSKVEYSLVASGNVARVLTESVAASYTAAFGDAFVAVERLRLANEGSIRENIKQIISRLITASQPGKALSKPLPERTSLWDQARTYRPT